MSSALLVAVMATASPAAAATWTTSQLVPADGAIGSIAAVSLHGSNGSAEELFWVPANGSVQEKTTYEDGASTPQQQIAPAGSADPWSDIAAVFRDRVGTTPPYIVDVFWRSPNGAIDHEYNLGGDTTYWDWAPQVAPAGSSSSNASLAVVSRASNTWELFWVEPSGGVEDAYSYDGGPSGRFQLAAPGGSTPRFSPRQIAAVSRAPDTMEVWWIGADGSIQDRYYYDAWGWGGFTLAPAGSASAAYGTAAITAVSRASNTMEVWWIGRDNSVQDRYYYDAWGWQGFTLSPANSADGAIASVAPSANAMNVTWTGWGSNAIQDASWGPTWSQAQIAPPGPSTNGGIASGSRPDGTVAVFWVTYNGAIDEASN